MTIHLSGDREQVILSLLRAGKFASSDEVIDEALRLVGERAITRPQNRRNRQSEAELLILSTKSANSSPILGG